MDNNQNFEQQPVEQQAVEQPVEQQPANPMMPPMPPMGPVSDGKGKSIAALVLGIIGVVLGWFTYVSIVSLALSILGIVFGAQGRKACVAAYGKASGMATAGLVLGIIGTCISALGSVCTVCACAIVCLGITA